MAVQYVYLFFIVLGVNLLPAFGPPTWTLLVFARLNWHLNPIALVVFGAFAATTGRYLLALGSTRFRSHLGQRRRENLAAVGNVLLKRRASTIGTMAFFAVSPIPSAQLFVAAGLLNLNLTPLMAAFLSGRLFSYSIYVSVASLAERRFGDLLGQMFGSPWSIAGQLMLVAGVSILPFVNWKSILEQRSTRKITRS